MGEIICAGMLNVLGEMEREGEWLVKVLGWGGLMGFFLNKKFLVTYIRSTDFL